MRLVFSNAGIISNVNVSCTVTLEKDKLGCCRNVTNKNVRIKSNVHRGIDVGYLNEFLRSILIDKSIVCNSNVLISRSTAASYKRNLAKRNSDRSTIAAKTPVSKGVISDSKRICVCNKLITLFYGNRVMLSIADIVVIDKKCKSITNSDTDLCAVNNVAGDSGKKSISVGNNVNRSLINISELTVKNAYAIKVYKSKTLALEYNALNGYRTVVGYIIIITDVETTGKSSAVICSTLDGDVLATESALVIGNLNFLCNSTCKKLDYVAVNRSVDSLGNGLVSCSADLCYCNKSRNVRINVRITTVCTCVSCITLSVKCRSSYNYIVAVTKSGNMICNVAVTTVTGVGCVTCSLTGRSGYNCVVRVTCSRNYYLSYLIVTSCTVRAFGKTEFGTGRINCSIGNHIVAECINLICNVAITTLCTSVGCVTCALTSRIGYNRIIGVTKSRSKLCATYCTSLCSSTSSLCACSMTVRGNYLLSHLMVASCTVRAFGKTCLGTSRSLCCIGNHIVTECINLICNVAIATICTGVCCITAVFTIGLSYNCLIIVTECINLVCNVAFATYTGVGCVTAVYTVGSSYSCIIVMNVKSNTKCSVLVCLTVEAVCTVVGYVVSKATAADLKSSLAICVSLVTVNCTNKLTAYNISSTAYDTLVAGKVVVPVVNCKCRILIGCTVIYDVTTLNSKSAVYTNGNLLI